MILVICNAGFDVGEFSNGEGVVIIRVIRRNKIARDIIEEGLVIETMKVDDSARLELSVFKVRCTPDGLGVLKDLG